MRIRPGALGAGLHAVGVQAQEHVAVGARVVRLQAVPDEEVLRVPVAPGLAHRARLRRVERAEALVVDHEPVREAVRVLVVEDVGAVVAVDGAERHEARQQRLEQVHLHDRRRPVGRRAHVRVVDVVGIGPAVPAGVRAVVGVDLDAVLVLEVAVVAAERDRRVQQVVVVLGDEVVGLDRLVVHVGLPRVADGRVPGALRRRRAEAGVAHGPGEVLERLGLRDDLLARVGPVVVVDVEVGPRERAAEGLRLPRVEVGRHVERDRACRRSARPGSCRTR